MTVLTLDSLALPSDRAPARCRFVKQTRLGPCLIDAEVHHVLLDPTGDRRAGLCIVSWAERGERRFGWKRVGELVGTDTTGPEEAAAIVARRRHTPTLPPPNVVPFPGGDAA